MRASATAWVVLFLAIAVLPSRAFGWTDARPAGLVTELQIERDGGATVTLRVRWRILAGRFRSFELNELPTDFALLEATASDATGNAVMVNARTSAPGRLEVSLGEEGGLRRGALDVVVRYTTSLRAQGLVHRAGDDAVIDLATVPWERGLEAAEIRVALPSSVRRAQWLADETPGVDATVTSELGRDVVHAIRRHVPAGTRWVGHIACDPSLFAWLDHPAVAPILARRENRRPWAPAAGLGFVLAAGLALVAWAFSRTGGEGSDASSRLIRIGAHWRGIAISLAALGGAAQCLVRFEIAGAVTVGTALVVAAFALCIPRTHAVRVADASVPARLWPDARALATARDDVPIVRRFLAPIAALASIALAIWAARHHAVVPSVIAVDVASVALGAFACLRRLSPRRDASYLRSFARAVSRRLRRTGVARVAWRVRGDGTRPGSVALRVVPRPGHRFVRGVRTFECGIAWHAGAVSWHPLTMISVRVERGGVLEKSLRLLAVRFGWIETSPDGDEIAWVAECIGPDRADTLRALETLIAEAIGPAPGQGAETRARTMLAEAEAHA